MNEKKSPTANAKSTEPVPEFVKEFGHAFPKLRPLAEAVNRGWYRMARALGFSRPTVVKTKQPSYHVMPRPAQQAMSVATSKRVPVVSPVTTINIEDDLIAEAKSIIQLHVQSSSNHQVDSVKLNEAIVVFENKYKRADLKTLSFDALVLYEQVMLIILTE